MVSAIRGYNASKYGLIAIYIPKVSGLRQPCLAAWY